MSKMDVQIDKVQRLIWLAEINFFICKTIYQERKGYQNPDLGNRDIFLLFANNSFHESVSILHSLLSSKVKKDIKIKPLLKFKIESDYNIDNSFVDKANSLRNIMDEAYPNLLNAFDSTFHGDDREKVRKVARLEGLARLDKITRLFEKEPYRFHVLRHQQVGHKNEDLKHPAGSSSMFLQKRYINALGVVVKMLVIESYFWFGYEAINPDSILLEDIKRYLNKC